MLLAVALLLTTLVPRSDGRFLEISKQPPGTVAIVPNDDDGESVLLGPIFHDSQELDREKASGMISVKLLNQYHTRSFDVTDRLENIDTIPGDERSLPTGPEYDTANHLETMSGHDLGAAYGPLHPDAHGDVIDMNENVIEDNFLPTEPIVEERTLEGWPPTDGKMASASEANNSGESTTVEVEVSAQDNGSKSTTTTTTSTSTTTRTTTVRKFQRKVRHQSSSTSTTTQRSVPRRVPPTRATTTTSHRPPVPVPRIDIRKLNLEHLENELDPYPSLIPLQALAYTSGPPSSRLLPRSIKPDEGPTCGCQHRKRSLAKSQYASEEIDAGGDYDDYDYDFNDVRQAHRPPGGDRPMLFPAMSRLLAPASAEPLESSVERAEKVHGTLERLMGIVTIFSHVDEFIQRKTKQSIRRLARLYESEEFD